MVAAPHPPTPAPARLTRLAPSPTGALHVGNARTFLATWLLARRRGWRVALRVEDLDGPRVKRGADQAALEDLAWLGLDWDQGPTFQRDRGEAYRAAVARLLAGGDAYPCVCTRGEVERAASAPHAEDGATVYPGTCRGRFDSVGAARAATGREPAIRFRVDEARVLRWDDACAGPQATRLGALGDFVIAKADGTAAYQLAVVVDDAAAGVTDVVRGDDLLDSTPRQMLLYDALALGAPPTYAHLPLVVGPDGRRLAKRHGDSRLAAYRSACAAPARLLAWLGRSLGIDVAPDESPTAAALVERFDLARMPRGPIPFTPADDAALRAGAGR